MPCLTLPVGLAISSLLFCTPSSAQKPDPPSAQFHPVEAVDQDQFIAYWTLEAGWGTELQLRNNMVGADLTVTPALRSADGVETALAPVTIHPQEIKIVDLESAALASAPQYLGTYGSVVLRYHSPANRNLFAMLMIHDRGHSIAFHIDATGEDQDLAPASREGIWWLPNDAATDQLVVTNQSARELQADLSLYDSTGREAKQKLALPPRSTTRLSVRQLVRANGLSGTFGGIRIFARSHGGSIDSVHLLFDETTSFSAFLKMFNHSPKTTLDERDFAHTKSWTLRAPMLALSQPDPALAFPAGTTLQPQLFVHNTMGKPVDVNLRFAWRSASSTGKAAGPSFRLGSFETHQVDVAALQASEVLPKDAAWTSVILTTNGLPEEIVALAASYDKTLRYGAQTPFSDQLAFEWVGSLWEYDVQHNSLITAGNGGSKPVQAGFTIYYNGGTQKYELEQSLQPDEQMWIDVGKLIREQVPDKNGKLLPQELTSGSYQLRDLSDKFIGSLYEGKIVYDKTFGHVTYGCANCCGYALSLALWYDPLGIPFQSTSGNGANAYDTCYGVYDDVSDAAEGNWTTGNSSIATVDYYGTHTGQGVGSTTSSTFALLQVSSIQVTCPVHHNTGRGNDNVVRATISQRGQGYTVSGDDAASSTYTTTIGTANLGKVLPSGAYGGCAIGYETIGYLTPSIYAGNVTLHRYIVGRSLYTNSTNTGNPMPGDDTSPPEWRDDNPQSGGSAGKVYDLDDPVVAPLSVDGNTYRTRINFYAYAALPDGTQISPNYNFFVRLSCTKTAIGYQFVSDVTGDNQIGSGTTPLTWNLQ